MLSFMSGEGGIPFSVNAALGGLAVYLDNFAIMDLAEGDRERRERFLASIHSGAELLVLSIECCGPFWTTGR